MKKTITFRLCIVIVVSMFVTAFLSFYLQTKSAKDAMITNSNIRISQIDQILENNEVDLEQLKENLKEDYFIRAKAAAYIMQNRPDVAEDLAEMKKIASLLQVDELHLFDTEGTLYAGSEPKYFNYTFNSGEQMQFFLPMLEDKSLQLCQDVTPNTAEGRLMQYLAVWREDHQGIVQIGMEPIRLLDAMKKNELSYIFSLVTVEDGITIFALDPETEAVIGTTDDSLMGKQAEEMGLELAAVSEEGLVTDIKVNGKKNYCVLEPAGDVLVGVSSTYENMYHNIPANMILTALSLCVLSVIIIVIILRMLDAVVLHGIYEMIGGMKKITGGDLDYRVKVRSSPEFNQLSSNINYMVESLLETTGKLSLVFENVDIPIAVYEYNQDMERVLATSKVGEILMLSEEEEENILSRQNLFAEKICQICSCLLEEEKDVYLLKGEQIRYVKIESYQEEHSTLGIIVDMTEEIVERQRIAFERDIDLLTGLSSRRAFFDKMDRLFQRPEELKTAMMFMADLDRLKYVNDNWGHEFGDRILKLAAELLKSCEAPRQVTARLSGDEFVLVIYGADSQEEIQGFLDQLYERMNKTFMTVQKQEEIPVRLSAGYVFYPEVAGNYRKLLRLADQTMYQVKKSSKGHFAKYQPPKEAAGEE